MTGDQPQATGDDLGSFFSSHMALATDPRWLSTRHQIFSERFTRTPLTWGLGPTLPVLMAYIESQTPQEFGLGRLEIDRRGRQSRLTTDGIYARVRDPRYLRYRLGFGGCFPDRGGGDFFFWQLLQSCCM